MKCDCKTASCVIGDFWTCKTPGCKNGPPKKAAAKTEGAFERLRQGQDTIFDKMDKKYAAINEKAKKAIWDALIYGRGSVYIPGPYDSFDDEPTKPGVGP